MREGRLGSKRDGEQVRRGWDGRGGLGRKGKDGEAGKWGEDIIAFVSHCLRPVFFVGGQVEVMLRLLRSFVCQIQVNKRSIYLCTRLSCVRLPLSLALFSFSFLSFLSLLLPPFSLSIFLFQYFPSISLLPFLSSFHTFHSAYSYLPSFILFPLFSPLLFFILFPLSSPSPFYFPLAIPSFFPSPLSSLPFTLHFFFSSLSFLSSPHSLVSLSSLQSPLSSHLSSPHSSLILPPPPLPSLRYWVCPGGQAGSPFMT